MFINDDKMEDAEKDHGGNGAAIFFAQIETA